MIRHLVYLLISLGSLCSCVKQGDFGIDIPPLKLPTGVNINKTNVGTFTFKGITYNGDCGVIPEDANKVGFQWFMSIKDGAKEGSLSMGLFPQETANEFGILWNDYHGYGRYGSINLGKGQLYAIKAGKIIKLSKTKFKIEGQAFADLSAVPIPFTAEGNILDLTAGLKTASNSPYPAGMGSVSFYTDKPLNGEKLNIAVWNSARTNYITHGGVLSYHFPNGFSCGQSESFYFQQPGNFKYEITNKAGNLVSQGDFAVLASTCNTILIRR